MSGIVGLLDLTGAPIDRVLLEQMTRSMTFRGPDAQDTWVGGPVGLGHALLRTTFESENEHQPFSLDGQVWITADARIDGRMELLEKLRGRGRAVAAGANDAELILQAYAAWGEESVGHLIGDFAFAIWDTAKAQLFCARDQFGVAPFFYAHVKNCLVFSNTLNCLRLHPGVSDRLNEQALGDFLLFNMDYDPGTTTFSDIQRLPAAHILSVKDGGLRTRHYWSLPAQVEIRYRPAEETIARFRELFTEAVKDRLRTECIAVPMSGGMDSSSMAVTTKRLLAANGGNYDLRAYTLTADHLIEDEEGHYAGLVASHAGIPIEYIASARPEALELDETAELTPEPGSVGLRENQKPLNGGPSSRVMFSGVGGDPLLMPSHHFLFDLLRRGHWLRLSQIMTQYLRLDHQLPPLYARARLRYRLGRYPQAVMPGWLNPSFAARLDLAARWEQVNTDRALRDPRRGMAELPFWSNWLSGNDPGYTSKPVKLRFPFFDVRLLSYILTVPPVPWFVNKNLLREAMRGDLPETVRLRPKTPLAADPTFMQAQSKPLRWMGVLAATPELEPYVEREALLRIVNEPSRATWEEFRSVNAPLALAYWLRRQSARKQTY